MENYLDDDCTLVEPKDVSMNNFWALMKVDSKEYAGEEVLVVDHCKGV